MPICLQAFADAKSSYERMNKVPKVKPLRKVTEEDLELEPLCSEVHKLHFLHEYNECSSIREAMLHFLQYNLPFISILCNLVDIFFLALFQLITYFSERMISEETLRRNYVMKRVIDDNQVQKHTFRGYYCL